MKMSGFFIFKLNLSFLVMRSFHFFIGFCICLSLNAQPGDSEVLHTEGLKLSQAVSGTINYEVTEGGTGTVTYAFDRNNLLSSTQVQIDYTLYGIATRMDEIDIRDGSHRFIYDLTRGTGRKKMAKTEIDLLRYKSIEDTRSSIYEINGGQLVGTEEVLGRTTQHWTFTNGPVKEAWLWDGIILQAKVKRPRITYSYTATAIDLENAEISYPDITIADN